MYLHKSVIRKDFTGNGVSAFCHSLRRLSLGVRRPSQSERLVYVKNGLTQIQKFYTDIHTNLINSEATPDMKSLATSGRKLSQKKLSKMPPLAALGRISGRFKRGSQNFTDFIGDYQPHTPAR